MKGLGEFQGMEMIGKGRACRPEEQHRPSELVVGIKGGGQGQ